MRAPAGYRHDLNGDCQICWQFFVAPTNQRTSLTSQRIQNVSVVLHEFLVEYIRNRFSFDPIVHLLFIHSATIDEHWQEVTFCQCSTMATSHNTVLSNLS